MSLEAMSWATADAPTKDPYEHAVLTVLAEDAAEDGCNAALPVQSLAERARMFVDEAQNTLSDLVERGLIGYGDQAFDAGWPGRLTVYDLLIPHDWFGPQQIARVNRFREDLDRPPLVPDSCTGLACAGRGADETGPRCGHRPTIADGGAA